MYVCMYVCMYVLCMDVRTNSDLFLIIKPTRWTDFSNLFFGMKLYMFRTVPLSMIRSVSVYTQQWCMSYRFEQAVSKPVWHIPLLCVQWNTPDHGQRKCPKHVEFHPKNKFEKLVHIVGLIIRNLSRCTVTWTSKWFDSCNTVTGLFSGGDGGCLLCDIQWIFLVKFMFVRFKK
jgi:hypothetical protein